MQRTFVLATFLIALLPLVVSAQNAVQLVELTASDPMQYAYFGTSIAGSGNTVVVGSPDYYEGAGPGAAYVFVKPARGWQNMTETAKLTPSDGVPSELFGESVAMSGDTIVVGCGNGSEVYVFVKPAGGWTDMNETARLTASDGGPKDSFGSSVSIDGSNIVVGANAHNAAGAAYVYVEPSSGWTDMTQTAELTASDATANAAFGYSVAVSGTTLAVGAINQPGHEFHSGYGRAYVFVEPSGGWVNMTQTAELAASDEAFGNQFGSNVSLTASTIVVGAPLAHVEGKKPGNGVSYVFTKPFHGWHNSTETAQLSWGKTFLEAFGLANSVNGYAIAVGVPGDQVGSVGSQGAAAVFFEPTGGWKTSRSPYYALSASGAAGFGGSLAISGNTLLVGASGTGTGTLQSAGSAYVFGTN